MRGQFTNETTLDNTTDPVFHAVGKSVIDLRFVLISADWTSPFDTLAIAVDLGDIQSTSEAIVWAVGVVRDPVVQFTGSTGQTEVRSAYYWSNYSTIHDVVCFPSSL